MTRYYSLTLAVLFFCLGLATPRALIAQSLRGSPSSINRMYYHAVDHGMYFYKTASGLRKAVSEGRFVRLASNQDYQVSGASYPWANEAAVAFVKRLAKEYRQTCGQRLVVTSGVRPQSMRLANSVDRSVHPTGIAIDLAIPTRRACGDWLREQLLALEEEGVIEATEEYTPAHFHVAVFPTPFTRYVARIENPPTYTARIIDQSRPKTLPTPRFFVGQIVGMP